MLNRSVAVDDAPERFPEPAPAEWAAALANDREVHDIVYGFLRLREPRLRRMAIRMIRMLSTEQ